jgi:hypothetical protein
VTSTDKSMPAAPADSRGCGGSSVVAPQVNVMLDVQLEAEVAREPLGRIPCAPLISCSHRGNMVTSVLCV